MLRRMATVVAATTALALAGAAPALADHESVVDPLLIDDNENPTCTDVAALFDDLLNVVELDKEEFESDQPSEITIDPAEYDSEIFVIVKGGPRANVYFSDFTGMVAPDNESGGPADISHVTVCGFETEDDDDNGNGDNGNGDNGNGDNGNGDNGNGDDNGDDNGKDDDVDDKETPKAEVPTEVPAGLGDTGSNTAGMIGLFAVVAGMAAGIAVLVRRRFVEDN